MNYGVKKDSAVMIHNPSYIMISSETKKVKKVIHRQTHKKHANHTNPLSFSQYGNYATCVVFIKNNFGICLQVLT
jgi:hypothetical protein